MQRETILNNELVDKHGLARFLNVPVKKIDACESVGVLPGVSIGGQRKYRPTEIKGMVDRGEIVFHSDRGYEQSKKAVDPRNSGPEVTCHHAFSSNPPVDHATGYSQGGKKKRTDEKHTVYEVKYHPVTKETLRRELGTTTEKLDMLIDKGLLPVMEHIGGTPYYDIRKIKTDIAAGRIDLRSLSARSDGTTSHIRHDVYREG